MHKYIGKWSACFVYPGVSAVFGQQRVLHVKPPIIRHTDHGGKDVDVNMAERHSIGRQMNPRGALREIRGRHVRREKPVASVSTSVPHGGADPVHFRNQIPESQCNWLIHIIPHPIQPTLKTIHLWSSITHLTSLGPNVQLCVRLLESYCNLVNVCSPISLCGFCVHVCWIAWKAVCYTVLSEEQCVCGGTQSIFFCIT